jgi:hypothetical protein
MIREKRRNSASKYQENTRKYKKKLKEKAVILLKERKKKTLTHHQHGRFMQNFENLKDKVKPKTKRKRENSKHISDSTDTHRSSPKSYLVRRQLAVHGGQLRLKLGNLTVQAANRREHCVLLIPVLQEQVIAPQILHIGLQMLDAGLKVRLLVLEPHPLQQRLLVF